jgi:hypothetical protein
VRTNARNAIDVWPGSAACRAFVDRYAVVCGVRVLCLRARGRAGFSPSASHFDFSRQALRNSAYSPFRMADPDVERPAVGDLLCFTRGLNTPLGAAGFRNYLEHNGDALAMHCDIVVAANAGGDGRLYTVGGNVLQGVTMRTLHLNRNGADLGLPRKTSTPDAVSSRCERGVQLRSPGLGRAVEARTEGGRTAAVAGRELLHVVVRCRCRRACSAVRRRGAGHARRILDVGRARHAALISGAATSAPAAGAVRARIQLHAEHHVAVDAGEREHAALGFAVDGADRVSIRTCSTRLPHFGHSPG